MHCIEVLEALIKKRAKLDIQDESGMTALHYASLGNNSAALVKKGAKLDMQDKSVRTALR